MATLFLLPLHSAFSVLNANLREQSPPFRGRIVWCSYTRRRSRSSSRRDINGRFEFEEDAMDLDEKFRFSGGGKRRMWWYDDVDEDDGDFENWDVDEDEDEEFPLFKVLGAFGWMIPTVGVSLLLGTGTNAILMALVVPLAQSVLSLVVEKASYTGGSRSRSRYGRNRQKRAYSRATTASRAESTETEKEESSVNSSTRETMSGGVSNFGGWDDLDRPQRPQNMPQKDWAKMSYPFLKQRKNGKLSRLGRRKEKPFFLRLVVAAFPFLGSWTSLLF